VKRSAFSLIELLIVVLIVGIVYTLSVSNFESLKEDRVRPTLLNLKSLLDNLDKKSDAELICLDECKSCGIYIDGELDENLSELYEEFFDSEPRVYRYDQNYGLIDLQNKVFFNVEGTQEEICFSLGVNKNGVSEQVIVEYKDKFYDFSPYFVETQVYSSASKLNEVKENLSQEVLR
jgi:prepilin-type N-terminal cleavage/methylation domain-containing protein